MKCFPCILTSHCVTLGLDGHAIGKRTCAHHSGKTWSTLWRAFVVFNKGDVYWFVGHADPFLSSADLYFPAQEAPKCVPRVRAIEANREPSARRRGSKQGPNFSKGKHGWTPAVPQQNNMNLHQKGVPISCAGCFWGEQLCLEAFCWGRCLPVKAFSTQGPWGPPRAGIYRGVEMLFKFQMASSFHSCHVNRSSSLKYILSGVYTKLREPALTPRAAFIVPPAAVSQYGTLKAALLCCWVKVSKFPHLLPTLFLG